MNDFFGSMTPNIKRAYLFFALAKLSCFTLAPGFLLMAWLNKIPSAYGAVGIVIYAAFIILSIFYGVREWFKTKSIPSQQEVEKWMQHYNLQKD